MLGWCELSDKAAPEQPELLCLSIPRSVRFAGLADPFSCKSSWFKPSLLGRPL